jgi:hypothetical protein
VPSFPLRGLVLNEATRPLYASTPELLPSSGEASERDPKTANKLDSPSLPIFAPAQGLRADIR